MKHRASCFRLAACVCLFLVGVSMAVSAAEQSESGLLAGWGEADVTPEQPVTLQGQFHARVSEGVMDPVTATAVAFESLTLTKGEPTGQVVRVSCDFSAISEDSRTGVREHLRRDLPELDPKAAMFSAAHTHAAPSTCVRPRYTQDAAVDDEPCGFDLGVMEPREYVASASERISKAVLEAWNAREAAAAQEKYRQEYEALVDGLEENPEKREGKRLYINVTGAYRRMKREERVVNRFEEQQTHPTLSFEVHAVRLGDVAFATNPFELYTDCGMQIKARSKAMQTFLVQLAGPGSYLPTPRSISGGAYGAVPASTEAGPESGQTLVNWSVDAINAMFKG